MQHITRTWSTALYGGTLYIKHRAKEFQFGYCPSRHDFSTTVVTVSPKEAAAIRVRKIDDHFKLEGRGNLTTGWLLPKSSRSELPDVN